MADPQKAVQTFMSQNPQQTAEALAEAEKYAQPAPHVTAYLKLLIYSMWKDNPDAISLAIKNGEDAVTLKGFPDGQKARICLQIGKYYQQQNNLDKALASFDKGLELDKTLLDLDSQVVANVGFLYKNANQTQKAIDSLSVLLHKNYADPKGVIIGLSNLGEILQKQGDDEKAIQAYSKVIELGLNIPELKGNIIGVLDNKGASEVNLKKFDDAIKTFQQALALEKNHLLARQNLAQTQMLNRLYDDAIQTVGDLEDPILILTKAQCYEAKDMKKEAFPLYNKIYDNIEVVKIDQRAKFLQNYAIQLTESQAPKALVVIDQSLQIPNQQPKDLAQSHYIKALILDAQQKKQDSKKEYEQAISLDFDHHNAYENLAVICLTDGSTDKAIDYLNKCLTFSQTPLTYSNLGKAYQQKNDKAKALDAYDKALTLNPKQILALTNRAQLHLAQGNRGDALMDLKHVQTLCDDPEAIKGLRKDNLDYIKDSTKKVLEIEAYFEAEKQKVLEAIKLQNQEDVRVKEIQARLAKIQQQKDERSQKALSSDSGASTNMGQEEYQREFQKMMQELSDITVQTAEQTKEVEVIKVVEQEQTLRVEKQEEILENSGAKKMAFLNTTLKEWARAQEHQDKFKYAQAFQFSMLALCDAINQSSTGVIDVKKDWAVDEDVKTKKTIGSVALGAAAAIPFVGGLFSTLNKVVDGIYGAYAAKKAEDKTNALIKVIRENGQTASREDWNLVVGLAGVELATRKEQILISRYNPPKVELGFFDKATKWVTEKLDSMKAAAFGDNVALYDSIGGKEGVTDVAILLAFIYQHYSKIQGQTKDLHLVFADIVYTEKPTDEFKEILAMIRFEEEQIQQKKQVEEQRESACCIIM